MLRIVALIMIMFSILTACSGSVSNRPATDDTGLPTVTVFRAPT